MQLDEIQAIFFQECDEGLAAIETNLAAMRDATADPETINTIFRAVHSIKGGSGAFGFKALQGFSHHLETVLDLLRTAELVPSVELVALLFAAFDVLSDHVASARNGADAPDDRAVLARLEGATAPPSPTTPPDSDLDSLLASIDELTHDAALWRVTVMPGPGAFDNGGDPLPLLRELEALGGIVVALNQNTMPPLNTIAVDECYLSWNLTIPDSITSDAIEAVFDFVADRYQLTISADTAYTAATHPLASAPAAEPTMIDTPVTPLGAVIPTDTSSKADAASATIRVELDKLDRLVNLVGELVITQAMLAQRLSLHDASTIDELSDLDHLTRELQDSAMSIRAQPVKSVFSRVPRIIRELEAGTGKRVHLEVIGEMTEVDRTIVERIGEPLTHMIRNAVDHGLEMPDERIAAGKAPVGVVRLAAEHRSGRIVISVSDDGKGIDLLRVRAKAIERGIISQDSNLSDEDIENLIFDPGFSTAASVSNISGRGVGMDVVRRNVQALGGRIGIASKFGKGSTFTLTLPLTLAILDGMVVSVGVQTYVIPLAHVIESLRPEQGDVRAFGPATEVLEVRGVYLPILSIGALLNVSGACAEPAESVLIVAETDSGQSILMVDAIQDQRQVVVKSLEANYAPVAGLLALPCWETAGWRSSWMWKHWFAFSGTLCHACLRRERRNYHSRRIRHDRCGFLRDCPNDAHAFGNRVE